MSNLRFHLMSCGECSFFRYTVGLGRALHELGKGKGSQQPAILRFLWAAKGPLLHQHRIEFRTDYHLDREFPTVTAAPMIRRNVTLLCEFGLTLARQSQYDTRDRASSRTVVTSRLVTPSLIHRLHGRSITSRPTIVV